MTASLTLCPGQPPAPALQSFSADLLLTDHPMTLTGRNCAKTCPCPVP